MTAKLSKTIKTETELNLYADIKVICGSIIKSTLHYLIAGKEIGAITAYSAPVCSFFKFGKLNIDDCEMNISSKEFYEAEYIASTVAENIRNAARECKCGYKQTDILLLICNINFKPNFVMTDTFDDIYLDIFDDFKKAGFPFNLKGYASYGFSDKNILSTDIAYKEYILERKLFKKEHILKII